MTDVYINKKFIGTVEDKDGFIKSIKQSRREGKIPSSVNIFYDESYKEVHIDTLKGRARRPLIIVENGKSKFTDEYARKLNNGELKWKDLVNQGTIEYVDASEEENCYVALNEKDLNEEHTHLEISPLVILGPITSLVPFSNFVQSSRLNRGSKSQKQALGLYIANYLVRIDTDVNLLNYPQVPIVKTSTYDIFNMQEHPSGQNFVIALMSYKGQNMQDAIILNKGSVERGLARSVYFRPYDAEELRYQGGLTDEICLPDKEVRGYRAENDYKYLEDDGVVFPEASLKEEDVMIGKVSPPRFLGELEEFSIAANTRRESSTSVKHGEEGVVDFIALTENEEGNKLVKIRLRNERIPELGDKFASRHGQKGVIGEIVPQSDMPFTTSGVIPDLIFSPHSIPSRMTISHLLEILGGKVGSLAGRHVDGTTFDSEPEERLRKELLELGFRENGKEKMYNGITGEEFEVTIFIGNMYYQKLKHMVANKLHSRASGRIQLLTRQPIEGRSKGGGLRLGEMEKDCLVAHGTSLLLKERFDSDNVVIHICEKCGMFAINDNFKGKKFCLRCGGNVEINSIEMSYAFKLLIDELKALGISPKIILKSKY